MGFNLEETFDDLSAVYSYGYLTFEFDKTVSEGSTFEFEVYDNEKIDKKEYMME